MGLYLLTILTSQGHISKVIFSSHTRKSRIDIILVIIPFETKLFRHFGAIGIRCAVTVVYWLCCHCCVGNIPKNTNFFFDALPNSSDARRVSNFFTLVYFLLFLGKLYISRIHKIFMFSEKRRKAKQIRLCEFFIGNE